MSPKFPDSSQETKEKKDTEVPTPEHAHENKKEKAPVKNAGLTLLFDRKKESAKAAALSQDIQKILRAPDQKHKPN